MADGGVVDVALYGIDKELDYYFAVVGEALYGRFDLAIAVRGLSPSWSAR